MGQVKTTIQHPRQAPIGDKLFSHIVKGATGSFVIQAGFAGLAFLNAIIIAQLLGVDGYGAFANAMAWIALLVIPATFGFGILLVRDVAIYRSCGEWSALKGLLNFSNRFVLVFSLLLVPIFIIVVHFTFSGPGEDEMRLSLFVASPLIPLFALASLRESTIRGFEHVVLARLPSMIFRPGLLLIGTILFYLVWPNYFNAHLVMMVNVIAATATLVASMFLLRKILPAKVKHVPPKYKSRLYLRAAFPMMVFGGMQVILQQTDIVMLGVMRNSEEVGLYAAASRLAFLLGYIMYAGEMIMEPIIARLYVSGDKVQLQKIITHMVRIALLVVLPFALVLIFSGESILVFFGEDFISAKTVLSILAVSRLVHVALGSGSLLLSMTGYEQSVAVIVSVGSLLNLVGNIILIPQYGIEGAAIASAVSLILMRAVFGVYASVKTGQQVTVIGSLKGST